MGSQKRNFFPILLLLGSGAFLGLYFFWPAPKIKESRPAIRATSQQAQALINKHLWLTSQSQELAQKQRELENSYNRLQVGDSIWPKGEKKNFNLGVDHSPDRNESNAYEDLNRYRHEYSATNPDQVIQGQISDEDRQKEYAQKYREEYARQFVENARRHGYKVDLSPDFVVLRVTRIPTSSDRTPSDVNTYSGPQAQ